MNLFGTRQRSIFLGYATLARRQGVPTPARGNEKRATASVGWVEDETHIFVLFIHKEWWVSLSLYPPYYFGRLGVQRFEILFNYLILHEKSFNVLYKNICNLLSSLYNNYRLENLITADGAPVKRGFFMSSSLYDDTVRLWWV